MQFTVESYFFIDQVKGEGLCHKIMLNILWSFQKSQGGISVFWEFSFKNGNVHTFSKTNFRKQKKKRDQDF